MWFWRVAAWRVIRRLVCVELFEKQVIGNLSFVEVSSTAGFSALLGIFKFDETKDGDVHTVT